MIWFCILIGIYKIYPYSFKAFQDSPCVDKIKVDCQEMSYIPKDTTAFGRVETPVQRSGKVEIGQKVNIKLDNCPYQEFGMILGEVKSKSTVPKNNSYTLTLVLPDGLSSSYNKKLLTSD